MSRLTGSKKSANDQQTKHIPPEVTGNGKINVQSGDNRMLSADEASQKSAQLRLDYESLSKQHEQLKLEKKRLSSEKQALKNSVNMRESQILTLRPYSTRFTRNEAQSDFGFILESINSWVEEWTDKLVEETDFSKNWMDSLKYFPQVVNQLRQFLDSNPDLASAVGYTASDQDIISACIVRFIKNRIFGGIPCSIPSHTAGVLQNIENYMALCTARELDMSTRYSWRAQAYHALFSHPEYSEARQTGINTLSADLANIFRFLADSSNGADFIRSISSKIVEPSLNLYENFRRSNDEYYFETAEGTEPGTRMGQDLPGRRLREHLDDIDCRNAIKYNAKFQVEKLRKRPTDEELQAHLYFICSVTPALKVRGLRGKYGEEPETLVKEKVLVAWDPDNLRGRDPCILKTQTWLSRICSNQW
ncbi:hypothetical protein F4782DRAFT_525316 [Xylaria castorea]|nr:hypothetical protein F4782DRAFT_525316 [Xylaria castorea]